ncbi:hypothetical protein [Bdellovibrio sp. NC01]|uniref:hypothetical protein n=1 Tax=Bdellovibrio sp. NC01 TaxID=2220073 RepID=UPI00143D5428|nr:hypothetical protein [Bdellovibrio sp. NC01]
MSFDVFLGIDQTGAVTKSGLPQPLPTAIVYKDGGAMWILESDLYLPNLTRRSTESLIKDIDPRLEIEKSAIILDSALGLAKDIFPKNKNIFDLMQRAHHFSYHGKRFGEKTAHAFFAQFIEKNPAHIPQRQCEIIAHEKSVFQSHAFQKNLSTGTFRAWSELGSASEKWFSLWPMDEAPAKGPWLFEAYPDLLWKKLVKSPTKDPVALKAFLSAQKLVKLHPSVSKSLASIDFCDAVILAYAGLVFQKRRQLFKNPKIASPKKEGWILGL